MSMNFQNPKTLAAVTNGADDTYYYYLEMDEFRYAVIQAILSGGSGTVTVTVEATVDPNTTLASANWEDITSSFFGVANITATGMFVIDTPVAFKAIRVKVVASTGDADDADWTLYSVRMQ